MLSYMSFSWEMIIYKKKILLEIYSTQINLLFLIFKKTWAILKLEWSYILYLLLRRSRLKKHWRGQLLARFLRKAWEIFWNQIGVTINVFINRLLIQGEKEKQPPGAVHKNFAKFTGKHLCRSLRLATLLKQRPRRRGFPVNFAKFLKAPFLQNTADCCLWIKQN